MNKPRILIICPNFYNYHNEIILALKRLNFNVEYHNDKIFASAAIDILRKRIPSVFRIIYKLFELWLLKSTKHKPYSHILVIKGIYLSTEFIKRLTDRHKDSYKVLYNWDSLIYDNYLEKINYFNKTFSFDYTDTQNYPERINYLPLFYIDLYSNIRDVRVNTVKDIDLLFIGSGHSNRLEVLNGIYDTLSKEGFNCKFILRQSKYGFKKLKGQDYNDFFITRDLNNMEIIGLYSRTKAILDLTIKNQDGITIRSIEAMGSHIKLVTDNALISRDTFYDKNNILIFQGFIDYIEFSELIKSDFVKSQNIEDLGLSKWICNVLNVMPS